MTLGVDPSIMAQQELVVPRSIPTMYAEAPEVLFPEKNYLVVYYN